ncbi:MAG: adenylate/guanylate cyclase domain-containing protein [Bacteroidales bacterium]|nr:adenylate/guanylate cyclase domain-containing protein [Bacteroidales bacterium]
MELPRLKLKPRTRTIVLEWLFIIAFVDIMMYSYYFFTWWGLNDYIDMHAFDDYMNSGYIHFELLLQGTLFGLLFSLINYLSDISAIRRKSFGVIIFLKSILYTVAMAISQWAVFAVYQVFNIMHIETLKAMQQDISLKFVISIIVYFIFVILMLNFIIQISRKFGIRDLLAMITGKYYKPTQERRIFLFIDMKDSTGTAERLGHYNYSRLIQSCIHDLTDLIIRYKAEVYQYVGDEVVLTWSLNPGLKDSNFINLFYAFEQRLKDKEKYYLKKFNASPEFKAGADEGIITVTEVGDIKREIAYHGEVLHTAARLEKLCNNLGNNFLVTESLQNAISKNGSFSCTFIGEYKLRGKESDDKVYGVNRVL